MPSVRAKSNPQAASQIDIQINPMTEITCAAIDLVLRENAEDVVCLDIVELIASRMVSREDYQVRAVGFFVRANIHLYLDGRIAFFELIMRFSAALEKAPQGHAELVSTFKIA